MSTLPSCSSCNMTIFQFLSTLPAVMLLDTVGRRPLLMSGALGCCVALLIVGSLVAAFGNDWPAHAAAGHTAIGGCICRSYAVHHDLFLLAFVYIYGINFAYSWAPIGWGMKIHLIVTLCIVLILFMQCFLARSSLSISGPLVSQLRHRVPGCRTCIYFLS